MEFHSKSVYYITKIFVNQGVCGFFRQLIAIYPKFFSQYLLNASIVRFTELFIDEPNSI